MFAARRAARPAVTRGGRGCDAAVTVLFTDIVGFTELLGVLGEQVMDTCRREHFRLMRAAVRAHRGREVKNLGDGLMVTFAEPQDAVRCALAMQSAADAQRLPEGRALRLRVGLHHGPTIASEGDHWGMTVVVARRLCDAAQAREILTTADVVATIDSPSEHFRGLGRMPLKGIADALDVYAVAATEPAPVRTALEMSHPRRDREPEHEAGVARIAGVVAFGHAGAAE